jgi:hypothetical protein
MSRVVKWTLAVALFIAAFLLAYVRISDAYQDFLMEMRTNPRTEQIVPKPEPQLKRYPHDNLTRT